MVQAVTADQENNDSEACSSNQLRNDWNVQSVNQSIAIGRTPNNQRRQSHGEEINEQVIQAESSGVTARRNKVVDSRSERAVIPADEECAQLEEKEERNFAGGMECDQAGGCSEHKTDRDNQGATPRSQASDAVGQVGSDCDSQWAA